MVSTRTCGRSTGHARALCRSNGRTATRAALSDSISRDRAVAAPGGGGGRGVGGEGGGGGGGGGAGGGGFDDQALMGCEDGTDAGRVRPEHHHPQFDVERFERLQDPDNERLAAEVEQCLGPTHALRA